MRRERVGGGQGLEGTKMESDRNNKDDGQKEGRGQEEREKDRKKDG